ncbi:DNA repair protein RecO [Amaricoccus solimangrovi]|uniref:DNA repair protein RecO n=1 Tax=Amaricoccus solimangrovi TaxID=2589815 RepID=A0A501WRB6_9RHOB|nr:DNA repair protein RecO [Amaricoccus solimangrovi]TPE48306.1 DNA repair protein RecO [Amaricoccus solimangrovi]
MEWRDEGILLSARRHGESAAIVEIFTAAHGRHAGVVRGGGGRRMAPILQPGAEVSAEWSARVEEQLGAFRLDLLTPHSARLLDDGPALAALQSIAALAAAGLPERAAHPELYALTRDLVAALGREPDWPSRYALWELALLEDLGFGLDLTRCAATGRREDLIYVSPKSGIAVSAEAGAPWAPRLLALPAFLRTGEPTRDPAQLRAALALTGFFLDARLGPALPRERLPAARDRAAEAILRRHG